MKNLIIIVFLLCTAAIFAQSPSSISGEIFDVENNNEPLAFGDVIIKGTDIRTYSNIDGQYSIEGLDPGDYVLEYSFVGYETQEINVKLTESNSIEVSVTLKAKTPPQFRVVSNANTEQINKSNPTLL